MFLECFHTLQLLFIIFFPFHLTTWYQNKLLYILIDILFLNLETFLTLELTKSLSDKDYIANIFYYIIRSFIDIISLWWLNIISMNHQLLIQDHTQTKKKGINKILFISDKNINFLENFIAIFNRLLLQIV